MKAFVTFTASVVCRRKITYLLAYYAFRLRMLPDAVKYVLLADDF